MIPQLHCHILTYLFLLHFWVRFSMHFQLIPFPKRSLFNHYTLTHQWSSCKENNSPTSQFIHNCQLSIKMFTSKEPYCEPPKSFLPLITLVRAQFWPNTLLMFPLFPSAQIKKVLPSSTHFQICPSINWKFFPGIQDLCLKYNL